MAKFKSLNYYGILLVGSLAYILLTLLSPIDPAGAARYNLSTLQTRLIQASFVLPIIGIWWAAFFGSVKFKKYAHSIEDSADGKALSKVSNGLLVLAAGLLFATLFGSLRAYVRGTDLAIPFAIANRYIGIAYQLGAFWLIYQGAKDLAKIAKKTGKGTTGWVIGGLIIAAAAVFYVKSLFALPFRNSMDPAQTSSLFLSDPLIWLTVVVPTVTTWVLGLASTINLRLYQRNVSGVIYKSALSRLAKGVLFIIVFSISMSLLVALTEYFQTAGIGTILVLIYLIVALWGVGYLVIASGAKKLSKIEAV